MRLYLRPNIQPCNLTATLKKPTLHSCTNTTAYLLPSCSNKNLLKIQTKKTLDVLLRPLASTQNQISDYAPARPTARLGKRWMEYQGMSNWEGLLDPLDNNLRREILRYGNFVEAAYKAFDLDPSSPTYACRRYSKGSLFERCGLPYTGYQITKNLWVTSGVTLPGWVDKAPSWMSVKSSWIGYVAVCNDKDEIARLGRRDIVIALRGTCTCMEWLENLRAPLAALPSEEETNDDVVKGSRDISSCPQQQPMVESGFLSLFTSRSSSYPSLQEMLREEIARLVQTYGDEPLSLTITGHSLGAALGTLAAYDIQTSIKGAPFVTVISFGGPRVGNMGFRSLVERLGTRVLRIVNSDDVVTRVPGFTVEDMGQLASDEGFHVTGLPGLIRKYVRDTWLVYAEIGEELRLSSRNSPYVMWMDPITCHDIKTYLHLVDGFVSSKCPLRATTRKLQLAL
ncbi:hypothetical protein SAY87_025287 [Trapa incisa]|uniref:Fungal lipase-type domain-containing protein n=1 Tax=Trapa incisa TaxID=236973 RepID=A0AAN7JFN6_9MYRT|nr:hypothetical protein SAY87_025287 [Trapa incisa]